MFSIKIKVLWLYSFKTLGKNKEILFFFAAIGLWQSSELF